MKDAPSIIRVLRKMQLGIDETNISSGGGLTHLSQVLKACEPSSSGFSRVIIWASQQTLDKLPNKSWLFKKSEWWMNSGLLIRFIGQQLRMQTLIKAEGCDILFSPGGTISTIPHIPVVTMSQNMLPFESKEAILFGNLSLMWCKLNLLRIFQSQAFKRADGVIFLTQYAKDKINLILGGIKNLSTIIPHGIEGRFFCPPRLQMQANYYTNKNPFCYLYVSILMPYKHQIEIAKAIYNLRKKGLPVKVRFAGASWGAYGRKFKSLIACLDPAAEFLIWDGDVSFNQLHNLYKESDAFIFGSSCENLPNIMIEAMASGLPIASSLNGPMPEVLGEAGIYFDPYIPSTIELALFKLFSDFDLRSRLSSLAYEKSLNYSWENCAKKTLEFIAIVNKRYEGLNV